MKRLEQYRRNMAAWEARCGNGEKLARGSVWSVRVMLAVAIAALAFSTWCSIADGRERTARWVRVEATAYCAGPCSTCQTTGITSTGRDANKRGVAVDPAVIGLGARLDVPGVGVWLKADDVGGAIKGNKIDVRFQTHEEAKAWGRRSLVVRVWE
jgi:3D (Asp-Asp-Asp) domain-containing protein